MNYIASITDFFKSPKWGINLLLGGVCMLIPLVGPLALGGWHITVLWARNDRKDEPIPDFDFNQFGKYLERDLWPFLVGFLASLAIVPFMFVVMFMMIGGIAFFAESSPRQEPEPALVFLGVFATIFAYALLLFVVTVLPMPLMIRATITQDFAQAFHFAFFKRFFALVWKEMILAALFTFFAGFVLALVGMLACLVGTYFAIGLSIFSWHHLQRQLYDLYLSRGGQPIPLSVKLSGVPPPLPVG